MTVYSVLCSLLRRSESAGLGCHHLSLDWISNVLGGNSQDCGSVELLQRSPIYYEEVQGHLAAELADSRKYHIWALKALRLMAHRAGFHGHIFNSGDAGWLEGIVGRGDCSAGAYGSQSPTLPG